MPIKPPSQNAINNKIADMESRIMRVFTRQLMYVGEMCVNKARNLPVPPRDVYWDEEKGEKRRSIPSHKPNYIDWTANLRSSIGYVVAIDGRIVSKSDFAHEKGEKGNGADGSKEGLRYARELAAKYPKGAALIVVAGMNYASYVQRKGYDVIASAELLAEQLLSQLKLNAKVTHL